MASPERDKWLDAQSEELNSFKLNDVYEEVPIPEGVKPITSKHVFSLKEDAQGNIERYKVRIVARGFTQQEGVDYQDTFAPVASLESIRIILALAVRLGLYTDQMDVNTAYLNGELLQTLYMLPPTGVDIREGYCWRLKKSVYGLKQAGRAWNQTLHNKLDKLGFVHLNAETCLYVFRDGKQVCFLVVYVDDLLLAATSRPFMDSIKKKLSASFKMRDLGPAKYLLGIEIIRHPGKRTISLSQRKYIDTVLERYGMSDCSGVSTPMSTSTRISADDPDDNTVRTHMALVPGGPVVSYQSVVGSLMYGMMGTRPDTAYVVGVLGRYSAAPKACHWELAKRVLRYLEKTRDWCLVYDGADAGMDLDFHGYTDADWGGCNDTSKSTSGFVFISSRGAIGWSSKRQSMVSLSSTESEYIGLANAGQHLAWLRSFFEELGRPQAGATELRCDNRAAIILSQDAQFRARTKHIQRKYHFVRDGLVATGECVVLWYPTDEMVADIFTKALPHEKHLKFCQGMGLRPDSSGSVRSGH